MDDFVPIYLQNAIAFIGIALGLKDLFSQFFGITNIFARLSAEILDDFVPMHLQEANACIGIVRFSFYPIFLLSFFPTSQIS